MKPILILYATREGHTHRIADHIAALVQARGYTTEARDAKEIAEPLDLSAYGAAILAASVHAGHHEREMVAFAKRHHADLEQLPSVFFSVSLSEAGAEDRGTSPAMRDKSAADVHQMMSAFFDETGWHPARACPVAGALMYTRYGVLVRWIMKRIARQAGASTDTSRDHVFTDWERLDDVVDGFLALLPAPASAEKK